MGLGLFLGIFTLYAVSPVKAQSDSIWSIPIAVSVIDEGNTDLDEYRATAEAKDYGTVEANGHLQGYFPIGASLLAVPPLWVFDHLVRAVRPLTSEGSRGRAQVNRWTDGFHAKGKIDLGFFDTVELLIASLMVSGAATVLFWVLRRRSTLGVCLTATVLFAFGTSAYSIASRVLWQHSPSIFLLTLALWWVTAPHFRGREALCLGLTLGVAYVCRPTNSLSIVGFALLVGVRAPSRLAAFATGGALVALPFFAFNQAAYGALLPPYYLATRLSGEHLGEALLGNLVSPARGLFIYTPLALISVATLWRRSTERTLDPLAWALASIVLVHWGVVSAFPHWWGGHCYGPRFFTEVTPYLVLLAVPAIEAVALDPRQSRWRTGALVACASIGLLLHTRGATAWSTFRWSGGPPNVDAAPSRLWDWRDPPFLR